MSREVSPGRYPCGDEPTPESHLPTDQIHLTPDSEDCKGTKPQPADSKSQQLIAPTDQIHLQPESEDCRDIKPQFADSKSHQLLVSEESLRANADTISESKPHSQCGTSVTTTVPASTSVSVITHPVTSPSVSRGVKRKYSSHNETYQKGGLAFSQHGVVFQLCLLVIFLNEAYNNCKKKKVTRFRLATEMNEAGKLDDVVFQYERHGRWSFILVQAKHEEPSIPRGGGETEGRDKQYDEEDKERGGNTSITEADLLSTNDSGRFALPKYFRSFSKIKMRSKEESIYNVWHDSAIESVMLCTNVPLAPDTPLIDVNEEVGIFTNLKGFHPSFKVHKLDNSRSQMFEQVLHASFLFESDLNQLAMIIAHSFVHRSKVPDDPLIMYYIVPLARDVFEPIDTSAGQGREVTVKFQEDFINGKGKTTVRDFRDALIREMAFRLKRRWKGKLHSDFGTLRPEQEDEIAGKLASLLKTRSPLKVSDFPDVHVYVKNRLIDKRSGLKRTPNLPILKKVGKLLSDYTGARTFRRIETLFGRPFLSLQKTDRTVSKLSKELCACLCEDNSVLLESESKVRLHQFDLLAEVVDKETQDSFTLKRSFVEVRAKYAKGRRKHAGGFNSLEESQNENQNISPCTLQLRNLLINSLINVEEQEGVLRGCSAPISDRLKNEIVQVNSYLLSGRNEIPPPDIDMFGTFLSSMINKADKNDKIIQITEDSCSQSGSPEKLSRPRSQSGSPKKPGRPRKESLTWLRIKNLWKLLAGDVFIKRGEKVLFASSFLERDVVDTPHVARLKKKLEASCDFDSLCNYEFNVDLKLTPWEEGARDRNLPAKLMSWEMDEFINKLRIVSCPSRSELSKILPRYLSPNSSSVLYHFVSPSDCGINYYNILMRSMLSWLSDRNGKFYTFEKAKEIFDKTESYLATLVLKNIGSKPHSRAYRFKTSGQLVHTLFGDAPLLHLECENCRLACARLKGTSETVLDLEWIHGMDSPIPGLIVASAPCRQLTEYVLVVNMNCRKMEEEHFKHTLQDIMSCCKHFSRIILVTARDDGNARKFMMRGSTFGSEIKSRLFTTSLADLTDESQGLLLDSGHVHLSDSPKKVSLRACLGLEEGDIHPEIQKLLPEHVIDEILHGVTISIGCESDTVNSQATTIWVNEVLTFNNEKIFKKFVKEHVDNGSIVYIEGDFSANNNIFEAAFPKTTEKLSFAFYLGKRFTPQTWDRRFDEFFRENEKNRIVRLRVEKNNVVIWQSVHDPKLYRQRYFVAAGVHCDLKHVSHPKKSVDFWEETIHSEYVRENNFKMIISGDPGIGKTATLSDLHNRLHTSHWLIRKELRYVNRPENAHITNSHFLDFLFENEFEKKMAEFRLSHVAANDALPIVLLLDGMDEVSDSEENREDLPTQCYSALTDTLRCLRELIGKANIIVTTRAHRQKMLEEALKVPAVTLLGFEEKDRKNYLKDFWSTLSLGKAPKLQQYISIVMNLPILKGKSSGTPLQLRMIGDVLWSNCRDFIRSDNPAPTPNLDKDSDLFAKFGEKMFDSYFSQKRAVDSRTILSDTDKQILIEGYTECHHILACRMILWKSHMKFFFDEEVVASYRRKKPGLYDVGIVIATTYGGKIVPRFFHETFAEHYVAHMLLKRLRNVNTRKKTVTYYYNHIDNSSSVRMQCIKKLLHEMAGNDAAELLFRPEKKKKPSDDRTVRKITDFPGFHRSLT